MSDHLHLAVALDGAGWHPAAWREPAPAPAELFTAGYWVDLVARGRARPARLRHHRGLLRPAVHRLRSGPDDRTDQVRGRLDAVLIAARVAPVTRHIGLVPTATVTHTEPFHVSKADRHPGLRQHRPGRLAGADLRRARSRRPLRPPRRLPFGVRRPRRTGRPRGRRRSVRRGRRLRRGGPPAVGQLGGRRRDPGRRHRPVRRPGQAALHRLRGAGTSRSRARRSCRGRRRASRWSPRSRTRPVAYRFAAPQRRRRVRDPARRRPTPRGIVDEVRARAGPPAGRAGDAVHVFADLVVFLDADRRVRPGPPGPPGRAATDAELRSDAHVFTGTRRPSWPTCSGSWQQAGISGFRLRPGGAAGRPATRSPTIWCRSCRPAGCSAPATRPPPCAGCSACRGPPTATPPSRRSIGMTTQTCPRKQIHLAAHFPGVNNTTVWSDPRSGSHIEFDSFVRFAQIAERAKFDFLFLAEGLRLREQSGQIYDLDVVGRPDTFTVLAALAAVTDHLGLDRHDQLHLQRAVRGGPPVRHPRPPVRRPGRLERGHLVGRVHRRELPPRRLPAAGPALRAGRGVPGRGRRAVRLLGRRSRSSPTRPPAPSCGRPGGRAPSPSATSTSTSRATSTCRAARRAGR